MEVLLQKKEVYLRNKTMAAEIVVPMIGTPGAGTWGYNYCV